IDDWKFPIAAHALRGAPTSHTADAKPCRSLIRNDCESRARIDYKRSWAPIDPHIHVGPPVRPDPERQGGRTRTRDLVQMNPGKLPVELNQTSDSVSPFGIGLWRDAEESLIGIGSFVKQLKPRGRPGKRHQIIR